MKRVVSGIIHENNLFLIGRRGKGKYEGLWEFVGGKVEPGETDQEALIREIREELGAIVSVGDLLGYSDVIAGWKTLQEDFRVFFYDVHHIQRPYVHGPDHTEIAWVHAMNIPLYDLVPADIEIAKLIPMIWSLISED